ncbi:hypothetical protein NUW54_g4967 [Trametes sanguinea]|uniref:Uncharacterized protein n=2 Tax=Trametes sanguinea TaxID=158606 RepID=A0ACC1PYJ2_9APHY|nr:hypothetical protein NUW54_g11003 [Trametes sanguinea]KAJ3004108.1 hypothetical protein NUW54_g4967 [Trametes sanguinea]
MHNLPGRMPRNFLFLTSSALAPRKHGHLVVASVTAKAPYQCQMMATNQKAQAAAATASVPKEYRLRRCHPSSNRSHYPELCIAAVRLRREL